MKPKAQARSCSDPFQVVFKALIVVHTLVRAGNQEKVLGFLSGTKMLGLETVVSGALRVPLFTPLRLRAHLQYSRSGFDTAQNLTKYASYLDRRIRTYGAIKYDIIRDKSERRGVSFLPRNDCLLVWTRAHCPL